MVQAKTVAAIAALRCGTLRDSPIFAVRRAVHLYIICIGIVAMLNQLGFTGRMGWSMFVGCNGKCRLKTQCRNQSDHGETHGHLSW